MQCPDNRQFFLHNLPASRDALWRQSPINQLLAQFGRHVINSGLDFIRRHICWALHEFHQRHGGIYHALVLTQECDRLLARIRIYIQRLHHLRGLLSSCLFRIEILWPEQVEDELNVVNLVHAIVDAVIRSHALWNVAGDGHPKLVRVAADGFDILGLHRAVNLHLLKPGVVVTLHPRLGIGGRVHARDPDRIRAIAVDDPGQQHVWTESLAAVHRIPHRCDELEFVAYVAHGGDARSQVNRPPLHLLIVSVHIPQSWDDELSRNVNTLCIRWHFHFVALADGDYLGAANHDRRICDARFTPTVDNSGADKCERAFAASRGSLAELGK